MSLIPEAGGKVSSIAEGDIEQTVGPKKIRIMRIASNMAELRFSETIGAPGEPE